MCHRLEFARFDFSDKRVIFVGEKTVIKNLESENCGRCGPSKPIPHTSGTSDGTIKYLNCG